MKNVIKNIAFVVFIISVVVGLVIASCNKHVSTLDNQPFANHAAHGCSSNGWVCM